MELSLVKIPALDGEISPCAWEDSKAVYVSGDNNGMLHFFNSYDNYVENSTACKDAINCLAIDPSNEMIALAHDETVAIRSYPSTDNILQPIALRRQLAITHMEFYKNYL